MDEHIEIHRRINYTLLRTSTTQYQRQLRDLRTRWIHAYHKRHIEEPNFDGIEREFKQLEFLIKLKEG